MSLQHPIIFREEGKSRGSTGVINYKLYLVVYCSPGGLNKAVDEVIATYNSTPHESLNNLSPNDVCAGRKETILRKRQKKKFLSLKPGKKYNLKTHNNSPNQHLSAN